MIDSKPMVDANGYVVNAYYSGPPGKICKVCKILGIDSSWVNYRKRSVSLGISPGDRVTPEMLEVAKAIFRS